jgi:hypothetical protein
MLDHITRIVQDYLQQEAIELLPWSAMSPDMNPIKHLTKTRVIWLEDGIQSIFNIITHDKVNNECNRFASCTVPENVSVCVECTVATPEPKQSLIPECFDTNDIQVNLNCASF